MERALLAGPGSLRGGREWEGRRDNTLIGPGSPWPPPGEPKPELGWGAQPTGTSWQDTPDEGDQQPSVEIGFREVDEDTGIEYEFTGGDAGEEDSWLEV